MTILEGLFKSDLNLEVAVMLNENKARIGYTIIFVVALVMNLTY